MAWELATVIGIIGFCIILLEFADRFNSNQENKKLVYLNLTIKYLLYIVVYVCSFVLLVVLRATIEAEEATSATAASIMPIINILIQFHIYVSFILWVLIMIALAISIILGLRFDKKMKELKEWGDDD